MHVAVCRKCVASVLQYVKVCCGGAQVRSSSIKDVKRDLLMCKETFKRDPPTLFRCQKRPTYTKSDRFLLSPTDFLIKFQARLLIWWLYSHEKKKRWRVIHDVTCSYTWYDSCMYVPWLIHTSHDAFVYVICYMWNTMSHIWMSHVTHMNESRHMSQTWTREAHKRGPTVHNVRVEWNVW